MNNKRGSILMLAVIFSLIMCLVGFGIVYMYSTEYLAVRYNLLDERARLLADAGLELGREFLYHCDARIEDVRDMKIAAGIDPDDPSIDFEAVDPVRADVVWCMSHDSDPYKYTAYGRNCRGGTLFLFNGLEIDNSWPRGWLKVWISSATDNMARTDGQYDYVIDAYGTALYKYGRTNLGLYSAVKNEKMRVRISSITLDAPDLTSPWASWPPCTWNSCKYKGKIHMPDGAMNMGKNIGGKETRYFFRFVRESGRSFEEEPTHIVVR